MEFKDIKERVRVVDVLLHYGIRLRCKFGADYAGTACPLPTHPKHDKGNNAFGVHLPSNRWQCKHPDCGAKNGVGAKWGDCINLVMTMDNLSARHAAEKIEAWFPKKNAASHIETRQVQGGQTSPPLHHTSEHTSGENGVKYMQAIDAWFDELFKRGEKETDVEYWKRVRNGVKSKLVESFRNGKKSLAA